MSLPRCHTANRPRESGQTLVLFVLFFVVLVMFLGLAIDLGFAYITKAQLSKAVDSACLAGMLNLSQGTTQAENMAASTFYANYSATNQDTGPVIPNITFSNDSCSTPNVYISVDANTAVKTFFLPVMNALPVPANWTTLPIHDRATATRQHLIVCLVLDRSGSMSPNGGATMGGLYLPGAVTDFINQFEENYDQAAMVSFATIATTDFQMSNTFKTAISTAGSNLNYVGGTYSIGGLILGSNQLATASSLIPPCENAIYAIVFFTDGHANMIEQSLSCPPLKPWIIGGYDFPNNNVGFWPTNSTLAEQSDPKSAGGCGLSNGGTPPCCGQNYFVATDGSQQPFLRANVTTEAEAEGISLAKSMQNNGWFVYCVGLSAAPLDPVNGAFLDGLANSPNSATYNANLPSTVPLIATQNNQLDGLFNQIAQQILLRLTQ